MPKHVMIMLAECVPGQEDAFNDWYTNIHLGEIVSLDGFVSAQRFELSELDPPQEGVQRYLTIYEIDGDANAARDALKADAPNRVESVGIDRSRSRGTYYTAMSEPVTAKRTP